MHKEKIKVHANKSKRISYKKFSAGQPVIILKQETGEFLQTWENKIYRVVSPFCIFSIFNKMDNTSLL